MAHFFSFIFFIDSIIAFYLFLSPIWLRKKLDAANKALHLYALASAIWSLGFAMLFVQTDTEKAYFWRSFAIFGTVLYMITVQFLICHFAEISKRTRMILNGVALTGIVPYLLSIQRGQTEYFISKFGMTYRFKPGLVNDIYTMYFVVVSCNILGVIIHMIRSSEKKRMRLFGKRFLLITILILLGTVLDMVFPAVGLPALPGSNLTQFLGLIILFYAMDALNRTAINVSNMSEFIYYSLAMPVLVFDEQYKLRIANEAAFDFFKLPKEKDKLKGYRIIDFFEAEEQQVFDFEETHYRLDTLCRTNLAPCNLTVSKIKDDYGDLIGYIVNVQDVSERMQYIKELQKARQEADSSNSAKSQFLANMSHEIRTPMNAIIGFSELALQEHPSPALTEYLEDIKVSSHNLLTLINDILDISKIESGKMTLVNIDYRTAEQVHDLSEMIKIPAAQKGLEFQIEVDPKLPSVLNGDPNRIRSILINLLNNSVKYTPSGFVKLEIVCSDPKESPFMVEFRVSDSGIGIREEEVSRLFEAFTQVDQTKNYGKEGTGLGLALVKGFCTLMNGNVRVESVYGEGSTFIATIEQTVVDATPLDFNVIQGAHMKDEFSLGSMQVHGVSVLIVDDNPINCKVISRSMGYYGMAVDVAAGGLESIEMCRKKQYDLVFMDQMMPEVDGIEAMKRIRELDGYGYSEKSKIIVLTANAIEGVREELIAEGFDEYLSKPINFRELEMVLEKFLPQDSFEFVKEAELVTEDSVSEQQSDQYPSEQLSAEIIAKLLPMVNVSEGIAYCGGSAEDYLDILKVMYEASQEQLSALRENYEAEDWKAFTILIHALKGSCLNIGAQSCGEQARELEAAGKRGDIDYIHSNLKSFEDFYRTLLQAFEVVFERAGIKPASNESGEATELVLDILRDFKEAVANFDFASAASLLKKARSASDAEENTELLNQLEILVDEIDVDKILSLDL